MAVYKVKAPDGSVLSLNGPENATQEQIARAAKAAFAQKQSAAPAAAPMSVEAMQDQAMAATDMPAAPAAAPAPQREFIGQSIPQAITAPIELAATGITGATTGMLGYAAGAGAGLIESIRNGTYGTRVGGQQMAQRAMQGLERYTYAPRTQMAQEALQAVGEFAEEAKLAPVPVTAGLYAPAARAVARPEPRPGAAATIAEAERLGVPVLTSDVRPPETFIGKAAQRAGERVPIAGTGPVRAEQQKARADAVRSVLSDYGAVDVSDLSDSIVADLAARRSGQLSKYTQNKTEVIERLSGQGTVPVPKALQAIDDQIADLTRRRTAGADEAIVRLQEIRSDLQNRDLFQLEAYRKDELAKVFMDDPARPMSVAARDAGEKALRAIYDPVRKDMGQFIRDNGERKDFDKWSIANKRLSELSDELDVSAFKSVLKLGKATPEVVNQLLLNKKPSSVRLLYNSLTPEGRSIVRTSLLSQIAQKAEIELPDRTKTYSPDRFNSELKKIQPQIDIFFRGDDRKRIEGLSRVLQVTRRAGESAVTTQTGQEAVPFAAGTFLTDLLGTAGAAFLTAGGIGSVARIYESAPVRNRLLRIQATEPGSPQELRLRDEILLELKKAAQNELAATGAAVAPTVLSAQQPEEQQ